MRILYLTQYFPPEVGATQTRSYEQAAGLVARGHAVTVIGEVPNHPSGIVRREFRGRWWARSCEAGMDVVRVWVWAAPVKTFCSRTAFYLSYAFSAIFAGLFLVRGPFDAIYATSPPLLVGLAALALSVLRRTPMVFEVRDLWPESAVALSELESPVGIWLAGLLERACYWRARHVVSVTGGIHERLLARGLPSDRVTLITNGANTSLFGPASGRRADLRRNLGLEGRFVVLYAGVHGIAQGLDRVVEAAASLRDVERITFLFLGEGPVKRDVQDQVARLELDNVRFFDEVPRERVPEYYSAADVSLVPLRKLPLFQGALPSKMFDSWACECPLVLSVDGEARKVLAEAKGGFFVPPEDSAALADLLRTLAGAPDGSLRELGRNGRRHTEVAYSREARVRQLLGLLGRLFPGAAPLKVADLT